MIDIESSLQQTIGQGFKELFGTEVPVTDISLQPTRKDFEGTHTFVTFPFAKAAKKNPAETARLLGEYLKEKSHLISSFNVVQGFLNLSIADEAWIEVFKSMAADPEFGMQPSNGQTVMVEYSSPNTNKPLHLGHLRNNFLGYSVAQILEANGYKVIKANLVNDRGIHICKSMLAYEKFGNGENPESSGLKGDHLVGDYYVKFENERRKQWNNIKEKAEREYKKMYLPHKERERKQIDIITKVIIDTYKSDNENAKPVSIDEYDKLIRSLLEKKYNDIISNPSYIGNTFESLLKDEPHVEIPYEVKEFLNEEFQKLINESERLVPLIYEAQQMLVKWEKGDEETVALWRKMNGWVYEGFDQTYKRMGVDFDKMYYESNTYVLGKDIVEEGLAKGVFFKKENGSVWIDLTAEGLDEKLVLRADGTSVYITQDLGTADLKYKDFGMDKSIYVVGNEQDYHFNVLFAILKKLGKHYAEGSYHLSYGMVDLPTGRMKSREGTVVDADDLMEEMVQTATIRTQELGKIEEFTEEGAKVLYEMLGIGALKYFLLKVDPRKRMLFNPDEAIELQGHTATFIQYTHARISTILRKSEQTGVEKQFSSLTRLHPVERDVIALLATLPDRIKEAGNNYTPSVLSQYAYELAKEYNRFFAEVSIFNADTAEEKSFRVALSAQVGKTIRKSMSLLGIQVPERM
ncbi:arginine--tRNA ligase [Rhodocytophaga rosea]|uniref:Arginine--tRNA ligase n=1 Tax=Rhodocytophaga rosea TaxID=2704465 RepID=A0A6C0GMF5_9BACT|nr:arginine--tRNA ligase [Rhodocytophaga rosea]QHT69205.1 arginine--tRNA ligase [Rhodocytophaga rosea]